MLELTVRKVGNSLGVILPAEAKAALKVREGDKLYLTESPDGYRLTQYDPDFGKQMDAAERVMREDRDVLRKLAEQNAVVEPVWIREDVVRAIHLRQLAEHGGDVGVRDVGLLQSALARPLNLWAYSEQKPDLASLAASYAVGIAKNHPFIDGNKRTAYVVCRTFLLLNRADIAAPPEEKYPAFLKLAQGELDEGGLAEWIRARVRKEVRSRKV